MNMKMRRNLAIAILLLILAISTFFYLRGHAIASLKQQLKETLQQQERLIEENEQLKALLARKDDLEFIGYLAKRDLGLILPGEEEYILIEIEREP